MCSDTAVVVSLGWARVRTLLHHKISLNATKIATIGAIVPSTGTTHGEIVDTERDVPLPEEELPVGVTQVL